jgi:acyl-CoA dehydrogenase
MEYLETTYGFLLGTPWWLAVLVGVVLVCSLGFLGAPLWLWTLLVAVVLWGVAAPMWAWVVFGVVAIVFNVRPVRRGLISGPIMGMIRRLKLLPQISATQRQAIDAGSVWVEGEFFSGRPDFKALRAVPWQALTEEEQAFLDGPVETLCEMVDDWQIHLDRDLPQEVWEYLGREGFWGMIIPTEYGGRGFSAAAHSAVIAKLASRSVPVAVTVMVPNSLGPAELLHRYGTSEQKSFYLPRLAHGEEIPCFALTEPEAGSDAGAISSSGVVFRGEDGRVYLRLNWSKRYITLASRATLLGLAFVLEDPENLLGQGERPGITCALIPTKTPGVVLGQRHDPLGIPFINAPTRGEDVVVPVDAIIGGPEQAGQGWRMLTESLAEGRGVSLPAQSAGSTKLITRFVSAYAAVRQQFGLPIGRFEGIEEPLARIAGKTYMAEALRQYTVSGVALTGKPAVISAVAKYQSTELLREVVNDGMDIVGGAGISDGPRNLLARGYKAVPIGITVEGANILTRTLIVFGQGVIRAHPFVLEEIEGLERDDVPMFDRAFFGHIGFTITNVFRSVFLSLTRGALAMVPGTAATRPYYRKLAWSAASFALLTDLAMVSLGGSLQRRETLTGRFADILSWMYIAMASLRRYEIESDTRDHQVLLDWSMAYAFARIEEAFEDILRNMPSGFIGLMCRGPWSLWTRLNPIGRGPTDRQGALVASVAQRRGRVRHDLTRGIYVPRDHETEQLARVELAFQLVRESQPLYERVVVAMRSRKLAASSLAEGFEQALETGLISLGEFELYQRTEQARREVITVDAFAEEDFPHQVVTDQPSLSAAE